MSGYSQLLDLGDDGFGEVRPGERVSDIGEQKAELRAAVEGAPLIFDRVEVLASSSLIMASVIWISPPAPVSLAERMSKISGWRM